MKQAIDNALTEVRNSFPSIYSKDDVISILEGLKDNADSTFTPDKQKLKDVLENVIQRVARNFDEDLISDVEFRIEYGNTIEIDSCSIDTDSISSTMYEAVEEAIDELFPDTE
jgi:hypothetical protein